MKPPKYFYVLVGEKLSNMFANYGIRTGSGDYGGMDFEDYEHKLEISSDGHDNFDDCEAEAQTAIREADVPFAVIFQGSKIYGVVRKDSVVTHEVIS